MSEDRISDEDISFSESSESDESDCFRNEMPNEQVTNGNFKYIKLLSIINTPRFQDVTSMINGAIPFLIDGDSLLLSALNQDSYSLDSGGQFLHVIYYCERMLDILAQTAGNFIIIFFDVWKVAWANNWCLQSCRLSLINHLKYNMSFTVHEFPTFYDEKFYKLLETVKPRCVLMHLSIHLDAEQLNHKLKVFGENALINETGAMRLFCGELMILFQCDIPCVDIDQIRFDTCIISSFYLEVPKHVNELQWINNKLKDEVKNDHSESVMKMVKDINIVQNYENYDIRRVVVIIASSQLMKAQQESVKSSFLRTLLLCCAAQEVLKLENRACPILQMDERNTLYFYKIIQVWHRHLYFALDCIKSTEARKFSWDSVSDLWQGTLFTNICSEITTNIIDGKELGLFREAYENLVSLVEKESSKQLDLYPIKPFGKFERKIPRFVKNELEQVMLQPIQNTIIQQFCGNIFEGFNWADFKKVFVHKQFRELHHWHSHKPFTDEFDHVDDSTLVKPKSKRELKWYYNNLAKQARYLNIYGRNLEARLITSETIICKEGQKTKTKAEKESKKAKEMKVKIQQERERCQHKNQSDELNNFELTVRKSDKLPEQKLRLAEINLLLSRLEIRELILRGNITKLRILFYICKSSKGDVCLTHVKQIFLTVRQVLKLRNDNELTEREEKLISRLLCTFGFNEIAEMNCLPITTPDSTLNLNWVRYQLQYVGPDLEKNCEGVYDPDVGYVPDPWQTEFINAIRKNESVLVIAPTSSGKTFASYYCMKRVLQNTRTGIVVYVAATKALVNQVAATVYSRFGKAQIDNGYSVVGIFTRDYKTNSMNSRILVTVPQCLDILLLSPHRYGWVKKIKYVIFDEVHCLSGNIEGLVWERCLLMIRCPFLALSATISKPQHFQKWLQQIEYFKQQQDRISNSLRSSGSYRVHLVTHSDRHSDLIKYTYGSEGLVHFHPFCALDNYSFTIHNGIPSTVSLSPYETLQLFDAMDSCASSTELLPRDLRLDVYFKKHCPTGFLDRKTVRNYERELGNTLYDIHQNCDTLYNSILQILHRDSGTNRADIGNLLNVMQQRDMLPAIIFSYDRKLVEYLYNSVVQKEPTLLPEGSKITKRERKAIAKEKLISQADDECSKKKEPGRNVKFHDDYYKEKREIPSLNILKDTNSKFKGIGCVDSYDIKFIEDRLSKKGYHENDIIIKGFQQGFGYHHAGVKNIIRCSVEMLFRLGVVKVVFATGTLALGIHMPCKSVVVFGDSPYLNSLEYHQMSGRAGRRGFDIEGNVIFMNVDNNLRDRLISDRLPEMLGNYPISVTLVLRLLLLVNTVTDKNCAQEEVTKTTASRILALLENSLIFQLKPTLLIQIKHFVGFASQLLLMQELIDSDGAPLKLGGLVTHLHYHEPANLALAYLIRTGVLRELLKTIDNHKDIQWSLVVVLSHLFARLVLHKTQLNIKLKNSVLRLAPLPEIVYKGLERYNYEVNFIFTEYVRSISVNCHKLYGPDDVLPLSKIKIQPLFHYETSDDVADTLSCRIKQRSVPKQGYSAFVALSGHGDKDLCLGSVINNIRHQIYLDMKAVPLLKLDANLNSYAADFYRHGIIKAINRDNQLRGGHDHALLKDFMLMLKTVTLSLEESMNPENHLLFHFRVIRDRFEMLFGKVYSK